MTTPSSTPDSKQYVALAESSKDQLLYKDFNYPLSLTYYVFTTDAETNRETEVYHRNVSVQMISLNEGLQLHLSKLNKTRDSYRLSINGTDKDGIKYTSVASITLSSTGTIKPNNALPSQYYNYED